MSRTAGRRKKGRLPLARSRGAGRKLAEGETMRLDVYNEAGEKVGDVEIPDSILGHKINSKLLHQVCLAVQANRRRGTHSTKTKSEVRGSGAKPYRQKHTGHARRGMKRSPLIRGGGITFGPKPRDYSKRIPKGMKRAAVKQALLSKINDGKVKIVEALEYEKPRTKRFVGMLKALGIDAKCLFALRTPSKPLKLSSRNIPGVEVLAGKDVNAYDILACRTLLMTRDLAENIQELVRS